MKRTRLAALFASLALLCGCAAVSPEPVPQEYSPTEPVPVTDDGVVSSVQYQFDAPGASGAQDRVHCSVEVPQVADAQPDAAEIINDYYRTNAELLCSYAAQSLGELLLSAQDEAWLSASFTAAYYDGRILSTCRVIDTILPSAHTTALYGETFDLNSGALLLPEDLFACDEAEFTEILTDFCLHALAEDEALLYPDWRSSVVSAFDKSAYYLTPEGYNVIYQMGVLAADPIIVTVPYDALGAVFSLTIS